MTRFALVSSVKDLPNDDDMPLLAAACRELGLLFDVASWDDRSVEWSRYDHVVLRSTWDYIDRRDEFLAWCERVDSVTRLVNPLAVARWVTDKHYLADLQARGVPVVPSRFIEPSTDLAAAWREASEGFARRGDLVVKPTVGSYSRDVKRFNGGQASAAVDHIGAILAGGRSVIVQPYLASVDDVGETNMTFFHEEYSHAIRKCALLLEDGSVKGPTNDMRTVHEPQVEERALAVAILKAARDHLGIAEPLLCARVDLIRDHDGVPRLLELDLCEPSLSLPLVERGASRFARALSAMRS